jgi:hypothetical protein
MSVTITLGQSSNLIIMFSAEATAETLGAIYVRAIVGPTPASPVETILTGTQSGETAASNSYAFNFHGTFDAGSYTVSIQWWMNTVGLEGAMRARSLIVYALPTV